MVIRYTSLANLPDLPRGGPAVYRNILAFVLDVTEPRPTKGTDLVKHVNISDPSLLALNGGEEESMMQQQGLQNGLEVLVFAREISMLPSVQNTGDIIRLTKVKVSWFNERLQLVAKIASGYANFELFPGQLDGNLSAEVSWQPYQRSSSAFTITDHDRELMGDIRNFYMHNQRLHAVDPYAQTLADLVPRTNADVYGQVVAVEDVGTDHQTIYLWDGTDIPAYFPPEYDPDLEWCWVSGDWREGEGDNDFAEGLERVVQHFAPRQPPLTGPNAISEFPDIGSVLAVNLYKPVTAEDMTPKVRHMKAKGSPLAVPLPSLPGVGAWVKLRNIYPVVIGSQLQALYLRNSKWQAWEDHSRVDRLVDQRTLSNNVSEGARQHIEAGTLLSHWDNPSVAQGCPYTTLRKVLRDASSDAPDVPRTYKCLVQLVDYAPKNTSKICQKTASGQYEFVIKFHVRDATAELDALILREHGEHFFRGCPQEDMAAKPEYAEALRRAMEAMRHTAYSGEGSPSAGLWFECCLVRIYPKGNLLLSHEKARYRIVDTLLTPYIDNVMALMQEQ